MTVAAYIRVSSKAQDHATQSAAIERAAMARGDRVKHWYVETWSARTLDRPELHRLRRDASAGWIRTLYVFKLDRLARSGIRDLLEVLEELRRHGCRAVSIADGFDLDGPAGELVAAVMAWAAKMERLGLEDRLAAARERLEAEGRSWGRPPDWSAEARARVVELRGHGWTVRAIEQELRIPRTTVRRILAQDGPKTPVAITTAGDGKPGTSGRRPRRGH